MLIVILLHVRQGGWIGRECREQGGMVGLEGGREVCGVVMGEGRGEEHLVMFGVCCSMGGVVGGGRVFEAEGLDGGMVWLCARSVAWGVWVT